MKPRKHRRPQDEPSPVQIEHLAADELRRRGREWDRELVRKLSRPIGEEHRPDHREPKIA